MACNYLWTLWWYFAAQYLLVSQRSVGVFSLLGLKLRVIFIRVYWASLNAQGAFSSFLLGRKNDCLAY
jgi:hypothetical protein